MYISRFFSTLQLFHSDNLMKRKSKQVLMRAMSWSAHPLIVQANYLWHKYATLVMYVLYSVKNRSVFWGMCISKERVFLYIWRCINYNREWNLQHSGLDWQQWEMKRTEKDSCMFALNTPIRSWRHSWQGNHPHKITNSSYLVQRRLHCDSSKML